MPFLLIIQVLHVLAFSAVHQGNAVKKKKRQSWTKWLPALRPYRNCVGVRLVCLFRRERKSVCELRVCRVLNVTAEGRGSRIKISAAVSNAFVEQCCGHTFQPYGGEAAERRDDECTTVCSHATHRGRFVRRCAWEREKTSAIHYWSERIMPLSATPIRL